ncbi:protein of unknown function [Legionella fallonii LLAP-10]|uniref:Uncharacterized protein n=1 Tax=Legionella fallonii LLAP-10 TaxID=1212491 RepID=A0A098G4H9_9GAMM|nr:protein of unknown function [Legionella fallonii LLAP-10]
MIGLNRAATAKPAETNMNIPAPFRLSKVSSKLPVTKLPMVAKKWAPIAKAITAEAIANWGVSVTIDVALTAKLVVDLIGVKKNERIGAPLSFTNAELIAFEVVPERISEIKLKSAIVFHLVFSLSM